MEIGPSYRAALAVTALTLAGLGSIGGVWVGSRDTAKPLAVEQAWSLPDWFLPVWDAYDRNPAVTPRFDFARLYSPAAAIHSQRTRSRQRHGHELGSADARPIGAVEASRDR